MSVGAADVKNIPALGGRTINQSDQVLEDRAPAVDEVVIVFVGNLKVPLDYLRVDVCIRPDKVAALAFQQVDQGAVIDVLPDAAVRTLSAIGTIRDRLGANSLEPVPHRVVKPRLRIRKTQIVR